MASSSSFAFSFSGDDIEEERVPDGSGGGGGGGGGEGGGAAAPGQENSLSTQQGQASAFPVQGKPLFAPTHHDIHDMLAKLPSKIAYGTVTVDLDLPGGVNAGDAASPRSLSLPRRELWDVRLQLMAEADGDEEGGGAGDAANHVPGLGRHDVKTGIYEGGFKSWESSVDLVKVLLAAPDRGDGGSGSGSGSGSLSSSSLAAAAATGFGEAERPCHVIELGCGTALPSVALFRRALGSQPSSRPLTFTLADYNPAVLYLVTLPNLLLAWALEEQARIPLLPPALETEGELELTPEVKEAFVRSLQASQISLSFVSGGWSPSFVDLLYSAAVLSPSPAARDERDTLVLGAETIYSPFALAAFAETVLSILRREQAERPTCQATVIVAAKRLYFGVGGSLDDFVDRMRASGAAVQGLREETEGVRRGVVRCSLPT